YERGPCTDKCNWQYGSDIGGGTLGKRTGYGPAEVRARVTYPLPSAGVSDSSDRLANISFTSVSVAVNLALHTLIRSVARLTFSESSSTDISPCSISDTMACSSSKASV